MVSFARSILHLQLVCSLSGEFGVVYRGNLTSWGAERKQMLVAVKTLKGVWAVYVPRVAALWLQLWVEVYILPVAFPVTTVVTGCKVAQ